ncbi:hypothetical protein H2201_006921 [Coniosporium apollinis]|uniref:Uncharacterized protein n=1 Tax=Coniosporium apollinis TaxID=61459 RepID=A0ABQ9NS85_9PEZI|nr:hypothetical protein H2201_006921 [Coniosporium apollinis]
MSSGVPLVACGRSADIAKAVRKLLAPEYDVIHVCLTHEAALIELPALLRGDLVAPSSGIGTNAERDAAERVGPRAVLMGGGVTMEEFQECKEKAGGNEDVKWIKLTMEKLKELGGPSPDTIVTVCREMLKDAGL